MRSTKQKSITTLYSNWLSIARNNQVKPSGDWHIWLILAGRGWGKTRTGAMDTILYALRNPNSQVAVVVPTFGDLRRVAFDGVSGILRFLPEGCLLDGRGKGYNSSNAEINLYNGSKILGFSATEPDRLRGPQFHRAWCDELCAWFYPETFDQLMFGLRLGDNPQCVITTTPKPSPLIHGLLKREDIIVTRGSTFENADNLAPQALQTLKEKYEDTRLGRQELYAEVLDDIEGALWSFEQLEACRVNKQMLPELKNIVVSIDPSVTSNKNSDETGIITVGKGEDNKYYVLDDSSGRFTPDKWARVAVENFYKFNANKIVAETNNGGDLVHRILKTVDETVPYKSVHATRGKLLRAEPISALYEQGKVYHVGAFLNLEDQMCTYTGLNQKSPDRLDALVWGLTELSKSSGIAHWRIS